MISEAVEFLSSGKATSLKTINFVFFDEQTFEAFEEELKLELSVKRH